MDTNIVKNSLSELAALFTNRMTAFEEELQKSAAVPSTTASLAAEFQTFRTFILDAINGLQKQVELLARDLDRVEMRGRRKILLVHGVSEEKQEDTAAAIAGVISNHLKLSDVSTGDIKRCHRMGRPSSNKARPILVKFCDMEVRDKVWFSKTNLKGTGITLSEFLTKARHNLFMEARDRLGVSKCWTREGRVFALSSDGSRHQIASLADLDKISSLVVADAAIQDVVQPPQKAGKLHAVRPRRTVTNKK